MMSERSPLLFWVKPKGNSLKKLWFRRFRRHRLAMISLWVVLIFYLIAFFAEIVAPVSTSSYRSQYQNMPPQRLRIVYRDTNGLRLGLHVQGYTREVDPVSFQRRYVADPEAIYPVRFFVRGEPYRLWGLISWDRHLLGTVDPYAPFYLLGADRLGRDVFSRVVHGTRVSLSVGLLGVGLSFVLGILLGGLSGYLGGSFDTILQRLIEFLESLPTIPLWMGLAAAIPLTMPPLGVYFLITLILSVIGWTGLARVVRGRFLSLKTEDFVLAARLDGASNLRIIRRYLLPSFLSHIIAALSLAIPGMILAETSLSFLGIGLRPPVVSWGVLLQEAQNVRSIVQAPWLLSPGLAVVLVVLGLNFLGDGLRDAADPHG